MTGAESGLFDLLEAMLVDTRMTEKEKIKKLKKFKGSHPQIWRSVEFYNFSCYFVKGVFSIFSLLYFKARRYGEGALISQHHGG